MDLITPTELARRCEISKQAVFKAIDQGLIRIIKTGKKKLVDLSDPSVQSYVTDNNRQREAVKKNDSEPSKKPNVKRPIMNKPSKKPDKKHLDIKDLSTLIAEKMAKKHGSSEIENFDPYALKMRKLVAETKIKEFQAEAQNKNLIPFETIDNIYFRYMERFNSTVERIASVSIGEIGKEILEAGEVLPAHIEKFLSMILNAQHDNKLAVAKEFKNYDPKL
jgi:hypothetical protein